MKYQILTDETTITVQLLDDDGKYLGERNVPDVSTATKETVEMLAADLEAEYTKRQAEKADEEQRANAERQAKIAAVQSIREQITGVQDVPKKKKAPEKEAEE